jgi:hypothetical protein
MRQSHVIGFAVLATAATVCVVACYSPVSYPDGVLIEKVKYEKSVLFRGPNMNLVSDLRQGDFDKDGADEILAVASDGIHLLGPDGKEKRFAPFRSPEGPWAVRAVTGAADGKLRFLGNLPKAGQSFLVGSRNVIWKYTEKR